MFACLTGRGRIVCFQLLLIDKKFQEVQVVLNQAGHLIETWTGAAYQKEYLKVFFLVLQVSYYSGKLFQFFIFIQVVE